MDIPDTPTLLRWLAEFSTRIERASDAEEIGRLRAEGIERLSREREAAPELVLLLESTARLALARMDAEHDAVRAREALLASVCHDLRNPLNTFALSSSLLRSDLERPSLDTKHALTLLDRMDRGQARMQVIIEDLLEASRIDAGLVELARTAQSAAALARDAVTSASGLAAEKRLRIEVGTLDEDASIEVDRARLLDLLARIISYAARTAGESGTVRLEVTRDAHEITIACRASLPSAARPTLDAHAGGLALLVVRGLARLHGGRVSMVIDEAAGADGAGATGRSLAVTVTLPAMTAR